MTSRSNSGRGLSVRQLTFIFLGAVGVCALFFALGYLVGTNNRPPDSGLATEQVQPPGEIPPTVNPPAQTSNSAQTQADHSSQASVIEQNLNPSSTRAAAGAPPAASAAKATPAPSDQNVQRQPQAAFVPVHSRTRPSAHGVMVQVSASHARQEASTLVKRLKSQGYSAALVTPAEAGTHDHIYRVQVGPYTSRREAMRVMEKLGRAGFRPFIKE